MTRLFLRLGVIGLVLGLMACGSAEEPTPVPQVAAAEEVLVVETAVSPTDTPLPPAATPVPAQDTPVPTMETGEAVGDEFVATSTPETADIEESSASASVTGVDSGIIAITLIGDTVDLYAIVPGQAPVQMTFGQGLSYGPTWSPNGQRIAYFYLNALTSETDLWFFDITTGPQPIPLTIGNIAGNIDRLSWSGDSEGLVYDAPQPDGVESDIYRLAVLSGEIVNLTEDSLAWDASPDWSPDGQQIAFVSDRAEVGKASNNIWLMDVDGGQLQQLTNSDATFQQDIEPSWSPDSSQIAFMRHGLTGGGSIDADTPSGLWLVDVVTAEETLLVEATGLLAGVQPPIWSPDGRWLAYNAPGFADMDIWVVSVNGGAPINVSNLPGEDATISWAPSSQELIFTNTDAGTMAQFVVDVDGSALRLLVAAGGESGLGNWSP